jgi:ribosome-associated protein
MKDSTLSAHIKLDQFLKWQGIAQTGGEAKIIIRQGIVLVNGEVEIRRGRKLITGDRVTVDGTTHQVELQ